jgi:hypothetical protein
MQFWGVLKDSKRVIRITPVNYTKFDNLPKKIEVYSGLGGDTLFYKHNFIYDPKETPCDLYDDVFFGGDRPFEKYNKGTSSVINQFIESWDDSKNKWDGPRSGALPCIIYRHKKETLTPISVLYWGVLENNYWETVGGDRILQIELKAQTGAVTVGSRKQISIIPNSIINYFIRLGDEAQIQLSSREHFIYDPIETPCNEFDDVFFGSTSQESKYREDKVEGLNGPGSWDRACAGFLPSHIYRHRKIIRPQQALIVVSKVAHRRIDW